MSGVFQNIDPPPPHPLATVYPAFGAGGGHTRWGEGGWGVNSSEDARLCAETYITIGISRPFEIQYKNYQCICSRCAVVSVVD